MSSKFWKQSSASAEAARIVAVLVVCVAVTTPAPLLAQHAPQPITPAHPLDRVMPLVDDVQEERYTKRGAAIGALIGAAGGLAFGTLLGLFCEAEGDGCWAAVPLIGAAGAAGGALVGGILGATVPRGDERPRDPADAADPDERTPRDDRLTPPDRTGSFSIAAGYAAADIASAMEGSGAAARATLSAEVRPWLAIGLEAGQSFLGDDGDVHHAAVAFRGTWPLGRVSPYLNCNLGYYDMTAPSLEFFGGSLGVGARVLPDVRGRWFIDVEARRSRNLQNIEPLRMNALLAGVGLYW